MSEEIKISVEEIINHLKISYQIPKTLEEIAIRKIIIKTAEAEGVNVEPEQLQEAADKFRLQNNLLSSTDTLNWLKKYCLSLDDFEESIYINVLEKQLSKYLFEGKIEGIFARDRLNYGGAVIYEIVLNNLDLALELFYALQEKEVTFAELARRYIEDKELSRCGGYRGTIQRKELKPEISAAIFAAKPPVILKPIAIAKQVHLIFVEEIIEPQLNDLIREQIRQELFSQWVQQELKKIRLNLDKEIFS